MILLLGYAKPLRTWAIKLDADKAIKMRISMSRIGELQVKRTRLAVEPLKTRNSF